MVDILPVDSIETASELVIWQLAALQVILSHRSQDCAQLMTVSVLFVPILAVCDTVVDVAFWPMQRISANL